MKNLSRLVALIARLRQPEGGCPWDIKQNFKSIAPYALEECYELVEAIEIDDVQAIKEELGDLLFQVVFLAQIGQEKGWFDLDSAAASVADKMIDRHPHVFGTRVVETAAEVLKNWEADKEAQRMAQAAAQERRPSVLDGVCTALPAATRAVKLQKRAARVGFDWPSIDGTLASIREETNELEEEIIRKADKKTIEAELGDLFFSVVNVARYLDIDPETALRRTNRKFENRFHFIEAALAKQGRSPREATLAEMETLWAEAKKA